MGSNVLAKPSFVTGPNDALITIDVFSGTSSGIVNSISSLASQYDVDLIGMLRAGAAAAQVLPVVEGIANGRLLMNPANAIARILTASNTLVAAANGTSLGGLFNSLSDGVQSAIAAGGQILGDVTATVGGVVSTIANGAVNDIQALGSLINGFAGSAEFMMVDNQALISMAAGVINQASRYGVSGAFNAMVKGITSPYILNGIVQQTMPGLVSVSDINSLSAIAGAVATGNLRAINPSICLSITQNYSRSASGNAQQALPSSDADNYQSIIDCYDAANPGWNNVSRYVGDSTIDLTSLQSGTDDFNSALTAGVFASAQTDPSQPPTDTTTPFYALGPVYDSVDPDQQLKDMYPNTYIDPALRSTATPVQPTQLQTDTSSVVSAATSATAIQQTPSSTSMPSGFETSAEHQANLDNGYNDGMMVWDPPAKNDPVSETPNPATYKTVGGKTYMTKPNGFGGTETYLVTETNSGVEATSTAINWGYGVEYSDGKNFYQPVDPNTLQVVH
jgi:hypothetical protein